MMKSIKRFFTQEFEVYRLVETQEFGRNKKDWTKIGDFKGRFDPLTTSREVISDKVTYVHTDNLFTDIIDVVEGDKIIRATGKEFNVIQSPEPFSMGNHLELRLERIV